MSNQILHFRAFPTAKLLTEFVNVNKISKEQIVSIKSHSNIYFYCETVEFDLPVSLSEEKIQKLHNRNIFFNTNHEDDSDSLNISLEYGSGKYALSDKPEHNKILFFPIKETFDSQTDEEFYAFIKKINPDKDFYIGKPCDDDYMVKYDYDLYT